MKTETVLDEGTIEISRISIVFVIVAVVYAIIMIGTLSSISFFFAEHNSERFALRQALFTKVLEVRVMQEVCMEEIPKIGAYLIRIKHAQEEVVDGTAEAKAETVLPRR